MRRYQVAKAIDAMPLAAVKFIRKVHISKRTSERTPVGNGIIWI